jgi:medium-chain acyl-[acyl-carrier-protein] hydrolase
MPDEVEVLAIQLPGRSTRLSEPPFTRLSPLIQALARVLPPYLDRPFAFFGHSMGALIGFELARHLRKHDQPSPLRLFVSGNSAPHLPRSDPPTYDQPEPEFLETLRKLKGTPEGVLQHPELRKLLLPTVRADFAVCETYVYEEGAPLAAPISAFGGLQDSRVGREELEAWREQTSLDFVIRMLPGDHFFLHSCRPLLLRALALELSELARARRSRAAAQTS